MLHWERWGPAASSVTTISDSFFLRTSSTCSTNRSTGFMPTFCNAQAQAQALKNHSCWEWQQTRSLGTPCSRQFVIRVSD